MCTGCPAGPVGEPGNVGENGPDYIENLKGDHPLSGPPGPNYVWRNIGHYENGEPWGVWEKEDAIQKR